MARYVDILYRLARFLAGIPPDAAKYLPAVFERADLLVDFGTWAADAIAGELFTTLLALLVTLYVWRRLPPGVRRRLRAVYERFFPSGVGGEDTQSHEANSRDGEKILREEIQALRERLEDFERRMETADQQQRQIDRLERELVEVRRPWWRRLFRR